MQQMFVIVLALLWLIVMLGLLVPQYAPWKNKRFKTLSIGLGSWFVSIVCGMILAYYSGIMDIIFYADAAKSRAADDFFLCLIAVPFVISTYFCWWYTYGRHSIDYIYLPGVSHEEMKNALSPWFCKLLGIRK